VQVSFSIGGSQGPSSGAVEVGRAAPELLRDRDTAPTLSEH
jgi:hypothetical protein